MKPRPVIVGGVSVPTLLTSLQHAHEVIGDARAREMEHVFIGGAGRRGVWALPHPDEPHDAPPSRPTLHFQRQTLFGKAEGNCFATCVAILFGLQVEDVPNFCAESTKGWWQQLRAWTTPRGVVPYCFNVHDDLDWTDWLAPGQVVIVTGRADRGLMHSTLYRDGELLWDPHPSDAGLDSLRDVIFFVAIDPRRDSAA